MAEARKRRRKVVLEKVFEDSEGVQLVFHYTTLDKHITRRACGRRKSTSNQIMYLIFSTDYRTGLQIWIATQYFLVKEKHPHGLKKMNIK